LASRVNAVHGEGEGGGLMSVRKFPRELPGEYVDTGFEIEAVEEWLGEDFLDTLPEYL